MSTVDQLKTLARQRKIKLRTILEFNRNVDGPLVIETTLPSGQHKIRVGASGEQFEIEIRVTSDVFFSVGKPNLISFVTSRTGLFGTRQLPVFAQDGWQSSTADWLSDASHSALLERLDLQTNEALHIFKNAVCCVLDSDRVLDEELFSLIGSIATAVQPKHIAIEAPSELPHASPELSLFFKRFRHLAEGDDVLRDELLEGMDGISRAEFLNAATPLFQEMNHYLASLPTPWPESASQLSNLAEFASELAIAKNQ